jgi:hypothetical protein
MTAERWTTVNGCNLQSGCIDLAECRKEVVSAYNLQAALLNRNVKARMLNAAIVPTNTKRSQHRKHVGM